MTGGLIQLGAYGGQNIYFNQNPTITFFKTVYKKFSNFSTQHIQQRFDVEPNLNGITQAPVTCKILRKGDIIQRLYFVIKIPRVTPSLDDTFQWVKKLGYYMFEYIELVIGNTIIDKLYPEYMDVSGEFLNSDQYEIIQEMIGNVPDMYQPNPIDTPTPEDTLYVPIPFYFTKASGTGIPLISLQNHDVELKVLFKPLSKWYLGTPDTSIRITDMYFEMEYHFLEKQERDKFALGTHEYLINQLQVNKFDGLNAGINNLELKFNHIVKDLIWIFVRSDNQDNKYYHNHSSGQNDTVLGSNMVNARFLFNGNERLEYKDSKFFTHVQVLEHHLRKPAPSVYTYSFSLRPEEFQPNGGANFSNMNKVEMQTNLVSIGGNYKYNGYIFANTYNFLDIQSGMAGLKFSN